MNKYYHLNRLDDGYNALVSRMADNHEGRGPQEFSNIVTLDETRSFCKVQGAADNDYQSSAILGVYTRENLSQSPPLQAPGDWGPQESEVDIGAAEEEVDPRRPPR